MKLFLFFLIFLFFVVQTFSTTIGDGIGDNGLSHNGFEIKRGGYPSLIALVKIRNNKYFCAASLITKKHALTAAHCIHDKHEDNPILASEFVALIGVFNITHQDDEGVVRMEIDETILHEDWKPHSRKQEYDADIAILKFKSEVQFSEFIQPVQLPQSKHDTNDLKEGVVVGWGLSERSNFSQIENTPKEVNIKKPPTNENCFYDEPKLAQLSSNRTFCAGRDDLGPCNGDSSGGFHVTRNSVQTLQGIVSSTLIDENGHCNVSNLAIYTNIVNYIDWIQEKILTEIKLECEFYQNYADYACKSQTEILTDDLIVTSVSGEHLDGKSNLDVKWLDLKGNIHYIPSGIGNLFPNLEYFQAFDCKLTKISRKSFENMHKLKYLVLSSNLIREIEENSFDELQSIASINLDDNKLKNLPPNLLIHAQQLEKFYIYDNLFEELDVDETFRNNPKLRLLAADNNQLKKIKWNLLAFQELKSVNLRNNFCINESYGKDYRNTVNSFQEIQDKINRNCA